MKLQLKDKVIVIAGRDKGKTGEIIGVLPMTNQVVIAGINTAKRHQKPTTQNPRGGIVELTKPLDASKVQVLDPKTGKPARIGLKVVKDGSKERIFKVSSFSNKGKKAKTGDKPAAKTDANTDAKTDINTDIKDAKKEATK